MWHLLIRTDFYMKRHSTLTERSCSQKYSTINYKHKSYHEQDKQFRKLTMTGDIYNGHAIFSSNNTSFLKTICKEPLFLIFIKLQMDDYTAKLPAKQAAVGRIWLGPLK